MATSAVGSVAKWLGDQLVEEANYLYGVEKKVEQLQGELNWMQCFLQDVDARRDRDARMQEWIRQISSLAYEAEDIIETFILKVELHRHGGLMSKLKRYSCIMREAKALHEVGCEIDDLKQNISTLSSRLHTYGIKITEQGGGSSEARREIQLRKSYAHHVQDEKNIVGLDNDIEVVVEQLLKENGESRIVALCGMGGLGKTTLAKKVYHHEDVKRCFDASAWACISQQCQVQGVLAELYQGLSKKKNDGNWTEEFLIQELSTMQQEKKCLIVLDDIWRNDAWDSLKAAFPIDGQNSRAGKLMLTTRNEGLVKYVDDKAFTHRQRIMDEEDALLLLKKKLRCDDLSDIFGKEHGRKTEELARNMLKHCGGLPLAIVALGGVLRTKKSLDQWKATHRNIKSFLYMAKQGGLSSKQVLELSYYDMPMYLKPCFLYFGIFPEDAEISARKLIQLWMAEGFISTDNSGQGFYGMEGHEEVSSLEEIGEAYLGELVERSMVQVASTRENGRIKTCRIHDLVRDLCLSKAAEENFLKVVMVEDSESSSTIIRSPFTKNVGRYRRLAIHGQESRWDKITPAACLPNKKVYARQIKTLVFVGHAAPSTCKLIDPLIFRKAFKQFRLLRVLDLMGVNIESLPKGVGNLVHLRYLSIRHTWVRVVPSSIGNLRCLQTLDLRSYSSATWSSDVIWRMGHLRHVYLPKHINDESLMKETIKYIRGRARLPLEEGLNNVEILLNFDQICRLEDIAQLTNLRKFSLRRCPGRKQFGHIKNFKSLWSGRLEHLSLELTWKMLMEEPDILHNLSAHNIPKMKLEIKGDRRVYNSSSPSDGYSLGRDLLPCSVTCLVFIGTEITNPDAMQILGKLPNLKELTLSYKSYRRKDMICSQGGFPKLISLYLFGLLELEDWTIEEGTMPSLRTLRTIDCDKLKFPEGMKHLHNLKRLQEAKMPDSYSKAAREWKRQREDKNEDNCEEATTSGGIDSN